MFSDNGGEFIALRPFLATKGITHLTTPPHTPEHNGHAERKHRHVVETGLTLLTKAKIPTTYWSYAFTTVVYLINRMPTPVLSHQSPFSALFKTEPNYTKLKIFGSLCFPLLRPYNANKLEPRSAPCIFLGYSLTQSAYLCLEPKTNRLYVSRHVRFDESKFPYHQLLQPTPAPPDNSPSYSPSATQIPFTMKPPSAAHSSPLESPPQTSDSSPGTTTTTPSLSQNTATASHHSPSSSSTSSNTDAPAPVSPAPAPVSPAPATVSAAPAPASAAPASVSLTTSQNVTQPVQQNQHRMQTRAKNRILKPNPRYGLSALIGSAKDVEPRTINQAMKHKQWRAAASSEFDAQMRNRTWDLVPPPKNANIIDCKWLFRLKYLANGTIDKHKGRLVACGFTQRPGVDYFETFSPVIKSTTIRTVLDIAVTRDWCLRQLDINNAFLQGDLDEVVYMRQPPGFVDPDKPNHVCRLRKALYGLKQAPRAWYLQLRQYLLAAGFKNSVSDTALFVHKEGSDFTYLLVYVDDIVVTGNNTNRVNRMIQNLAKTFSLKDMGDLSYFLGIEVVRSSSGLHLSQRKYTIDLLQRMNMMDAKPATTPMATSPKLTLAGEAYKDPKEYRTLVGSLQYLAFTRPDIAFVVNKLSQFMQSPTNDHFQAAKRVLRYLAGTVTHGLFLRRSNPLNLHAFSYSDWAGDADDFTSTNAYIVYLGNQPISWSSKKQKSVARFSTEAEYRSVANTASELIWVCSLLQELGLNQGQPPVIYCDNIGATYLCANPVFHSRMKHVALDFHFIRELVQSNRLRVSHVSTHDQLADCLTKPLGRPRFLQLRDKIGVSTGPPS